MTAPTTTETGTAATAPEVTATEPAPAATTPATETAPTTRRSLESALAALDDDTRSYVLETVKTARNEAKNLRDRLKDAEPRLSEYDRLVEASKTEEQRARDAATAAQSRVEQLTTRAVMAEVKALAATSFADPTDASAFINPADYINDDGDVDTDAIKTALDDLLTRKPHLGRVDGKRTPAPNPAQGSSASGPTTAGQLTKEDLQRMYAAGDHDGIEKARQEGRFNQLTGAKP